MFIRLKALKPKDFPESPKSLGQHVKKRRLELGLTQEQVSERLHVSLFTVLNWENEKTHPPVRALPALIQFLGYDPVADPQTLAEQLYAIRRRLGWSNKRAARELGVDEETWAVWEKGTRTPSAKHATLLEDFLAQGDLAATKVR